LLRFARNDYVDGGETMTLKGKVVLITGSTRGIGKEFAIGFAKKGADLIINGRNLEKAKGVAKEMEGFGVRILAYEWSKYHITVNAIAPGFVAAGMNTPVLTKEILVSGLANKVPLKRLGKPEEIVSLTLFLASEDSSYINGTTVVSDGRMPGYSPVGFIDLIAEMMKKKGVDNRCRVCEYKASSKEVQQSSIEERRVRVKILKDINHAN